MPAGSVPRRTANARYRALQLGDGLVDDPLDDLKFIIEKIQPRTDRHLSFDSNFALIRTRHQLHPDIGREQQTCHQDQNSDSHDESTIGQGKMQKFLVSVFQGFQESPAHFEDATAKAVLEFLIARRARKDASRKHRNNRQRHPERAQQRKTDHNRKLLEHHAGHSLDENQGQKNHQRRQRAGNHRGGDFLGAINGRTLQLFARLPHAKDVLEHHD